MKKFLKALAVIAAVAALGFGFASCSSDDDDGGSGSSALASFVHTEDYGTETTIYFYSDNTWEYIERNYKGTKDYKGTYAITSGDFTKGTLDFTVVEHSGIKCGWEKVSLEIKDSVFYLRLYGTLPVVGVNDEDLDKYVKQ